MLEYRRCQRKTFRGIGPGTDFVDQHETRYRGLLQNCLKVFEVRAETAQIVFDRLFVSRIDKEAVENRELALRRGRNVAARLDKNGEKPNGLHRNTFPPCIRPRND